MRSGSDDLGGIGRPTVVKDMEVTAGKLRDSFDAILRAGTECIETIERLKGDGD